MLPVSAFAQIVLLSSVDGLSLQLLGHLQTCSYPSVCKDSCDETALQTPCPLSITDCPCIINACWSLYASCLHACSGVILTSCLQCLQAGSRIRCYAECSGVCVDTVCQHSQGECYGCAPGLFGSSCSEDCSRVCNGSCYKNTGYCKVCQSGRYGRTCEHRCSNFCHTCSPQNGSCLRCADGYTGENCSLTCTDGFHGPGCARKCPEHCSGTCHHISGFCAGGCEPGYFTADCSKKCPSGKFGQDCSSECPVTCAETTVCDHINGSCPHGCHSGFRGEQCDVSCSMGTYGPNCSSNCSSNCFFGVCNRFSGHCHRCVDGRAGAFCEYLTDLGHSRISESDGIMSTEQTILVFLGLFAMGGAMWFLLATFVYCKQKIIIKKVEETGTLPENWTSIIRRYPQYFYNPRLLSKPKDGWGAPGALKRTLATQKKQLSRAGTPQIVSLDELPPRLRQKLAKKVEMQVRRKRIQAESPDKSSTPDKDISEAKASNQLEISSGRKVKTSFSKLLERSSHECPSSVTSDVDRQRETAGGNEKSFKTTREDDSKLTVIDGTEEGTVLKDIGAAIEQGDQSECVNVESMFIENEDPQTQVKSRILYDSLKDGAGDTRSSTLFDLSMSTTPGLEAGRNRHVPPAPARMSRGMTQADELSHGPRRAGRSPRRDLQEMRRPSRYGAQSFMDQPGRSATSSVCPACGQPCVCSIECQCSAVTSATGHKDSVAAVLGRAHKAQVLGNKLLVHEHRPSTASSAHSHAKLSAVHKRDTAKGKDMPRPVQSRTETQPSRNRRRSRSRHTLTSSVDASRVETSTAGDSERALSSDIATSASGTSTAPIQQRKTASYTATESEDELTESASNTIVTTDITETSVESAYIHRPSLTESQHRYFQAALERQSQPYLAKTDMVRTFGEDIMGPGAQSSYTPGYYSDKAKYSDRNTKSPGLFQRGFRSIVGVFGKLMGVQPQQTMSKDNSTAGASKIFWPIEPSTSQFLVHRLESWSQSRDAATGTTRHARDTAHPRLLRAPPGTDKVSTEETLTERSSAMSNTLRTSSRTYKEDSTLTDASETDLPTPSSSPDVSASSSFRSSRASGTTESTSSGTSEVTSGKPSSTDLESLSVAARSRGQPSSRYLRPHKHE